MHLLQHDPKCVTHTNTDTFQSTTSQSIFSSVTEHLDNVNFNVLLIHCSNQSCTDESEIYAE